LFLHAYLHPHTLDEGSAGTIDATDELSHHENLTPGAYDHVPLLSTEQLLTHSRTPQREDVGAPSTGRRTPNHAEQGQGIDATNNTTDIA
jgi:hypothetical protein